MNMTCPACGGPMSPLFTGSFCPRDCDRPRAVTQAPTGRSGPWESFDTGGCFIDGDYKSWYIYGYSAGMSLAVDDFPPESDIRGWMVDPADNILNSPITLLSFCKKEWADHPSHAVAWRVSDYGNIEDSRKAMVKLVMTSGFDLIVLRLVDE
ncbi:MAG: hypothetical protein WC763_06055 [Candidatus Paceibacterota bacterium]|jgi:hypothetical protein